MKIHYRSELVGEVKEAKTLDNLIINGQGFVSENTYTAFSTRGMQMGKSLDVNRPFVFIIMKEAKSGKTPLSAYYVMEKSFDGFVPEEEQDDLNFSIMDDASNDSNWDSLSEAEQGLVKQAYPNEILYNAYSWKVEKNIFLVYKPEFQHWYPEKGGPLLTQNKEGKILPDFFYRGTFRIIIRDDNVNESNFHIFQKYGLVIKGVKVTKIKIEQEEEPACTSDPSIRH